MTTVRWILETKGQNVATIGPDNTVYDAIRLMAEKNVGALCIIEQERVVGIVSERDCARSLLRDDRPSQTVPLREIMTRAVLYVRPEQTIEECAALMTDKHLRHLPVMDGNRLIGIVSMRDVVRQVISNQEFIIEQLENYIRS